MSQVRGVVALLAAGVLLAGCGGGGTGGSSDSGAEPDEAASSATDESEEGFDPASATLPEGTFCGDLDLGTVAQGLGVAEAQLKPVKTTAVGDKLTPGPGIPPMPATANMCQLGKETGTVGFTMAIAPGFDEDMNKTLVEEALNRPQEKPGKNTVMYTDCKAEETTVVGADGVVDICRIIGASEPRTTVKVSGMAGNGKITCVAQTQGKQADPAQLEGALTDTCAQVMEELATG